MTKKFYRFRGAYQENEVRIQAVQEYDTLNFIGKESILISNNKFFVKSGKKFFDIIEFNDSSNFAISEKLKEVLSINSINGWCCFPIEIINYSMMNYYAFQNLSEAGPILNLEELNNYETENAKFDLDSWDGSDIFHLKDTALNICTEKVKKIFEENNISNVEIKLL